MNRRDLLGALAAIPALRGSEEDPGGRTWLAVTDFGAVGDGTSDCTPAFKRAFEALGRPRHGKIGGRLLVPEGIFRVRETLRVPSRVRITGEVARVSVVQAAPDFIGGPLFSYDEGGTGAFDARLEALHLDAADHSGVECLVRAAAWNEQCGLRNCVLTAFRGVALDLTRGDGGTAALQVIDSEFYASRKGALAGIRLRMPFRVAYPVLLLDQVTIAGPAGMDGGFTAVTLDNGICQARMLHVEWCDAAVVVEGRADAVLQSCTGSPNRVDTLVQCAAGWSGRVLLSGSRRAGARRLLTDAVRGSEWMAAADDWCGVQEWPPAPGAVLGTVTVSGPQVQWSGGIRGARLDAEGRLVVELPGGARTAAICGVAMMTLGTGGPIGPWSAVTTPDGFVVAWGAPGRDVSASYRVTLNLP